jgi:hypothetical protein
LTVFNKVKATEFRQTFPAASSGNKDMEKNKWHKIGHNHSSVAYVYTLVITARLTSFLLPPSRVFLLPLAAAAAVQFAKRKCQLRVFEKRQGSGIPNQKPT